MEFSSDQIVMFRMAERLTLTLVILIVAFVVMVGFWRTVQKLDMAEGGKLGVAGSFAFSTPVFVLLTIVGYAHVSLSNPISVSLPGSPASPAGAPEQVAGTPATGGFIGGTAEAEPTSDPDYTRGIAERQVRSLNCLASGQDLSPRVADDLALVKLALLAPVWPEAWGEIDAFAAWAQGLSTEAPNAAAREAFEREHVVC